MAITDLIPWRKPRVPVRREPEHSLDTWHDQVDRLFEEAFGFRWSTPGSLVPGGSLEDLWQDFDPRVDVVETDRALQVSVELPGMDEKDLSVTVSRGTLTISGEKVQEREEKTKTYYRVERSYGSFRRTVSLPSQVDADRADAAFKNGVLTITFPKVRETKDWKKIPVRTR